MDMRFIKTNFMKKLLFSGLIAFVFGLSGAALAADTWTMPSEIDEGIWMEAYGDGTPGSENSELFASDGYAGPEGVQWILSDAKLVPPVSPVPPPWEYQTIYEGGTLSLGERPSLWGDAIEIPMTITNLNRTEGDNLTFEIVGTGTAGGYHWKFEASYDGPNNHPDNFDVLWEAFHPDDPGRVGHMGYYFSAITLTRTIATKITWTSESGQFDEGDWMEAYSPLNPNPGSVGSQLYAIDLEDTPGDQWEFNSAATMNDPPVPLPPTSYWQYETVYEGGILSLGSEPSLWGDVIDIPMNVKNLSRHYGPNMFLEFNAVGVGMAGGFYWKFDVTYDGPEDSTNFAEMWEMYHPGDTDRVGHSGPLNTIELTRILLFEDVDPGHWAEEAIYKIFFAGITKGCSADPLLYCPNKAVSKAAMAVFLLRSLHGGDYVPPPAEGIFVDVDVNQWYAPWVEQLYREGITRGCSGDPLMYCPDRHVSKASMALFLLRAKYGGSYVPPAATGLFEDVDLSHWGADWIEQLYNDGITKGCSEDPLMYCPDRDVSKAAMALFLVRTFNLDW